MYMQRTAMEFGNFPFAFHDTMYTEKFDIYTEIWDYLTPEAHEIWMDPSETVIDDELVFV